MKRTCRYLPLLSLLLFCLPLAVAQSSFDLGLGFGTNFDKSTGAGIDNLNSSNAFGTCTVGTGDANCQATPALNSFFMGITANLMAWKHLGVGGNITFTPVKKDYGPLQFRQSFYDFNGIYLPVNQKKYNVQLIGGIGAAKTGFSYTQSGCVGTAVCSTSSQPVGNSTHFAVHAGAAVQIYVNDHVFIRPQFDLHFVPNFTDQFGSNIAPGFMVYVGYSLGDRQ